MRSGIERYQALADGVAGETRNVMDVERPHQLAPIRLGSLGADSKLLRDPLGGVTFGDQLQHFALARRQSLERGSLLIDAFEAVSDYVPGDRRAEETLAARGGPYGQLQLSGTVGLDHVADGSGAQRS